MIEAPVHPHNARYIPTPLVAWQPAAIDYSGPQAWAAVRVDVGGNRLIREIDVLAASPLFPADVDLTQWVLEGLDLTYFSDKEHRMFVYLAIQAGEYELSLSDATVLAPLCCCPLIQCNPQLCTYCVAGPEGEVDSGGSE